MNRKETIEIIAILKAAFPYWGNKLSDQELKTSVKLWNEMLEDFDCTVVRGAVKILIASKKDFPPSIGEVIEKCNFISSGGKIEMTELEAWARVKSAISNSAYNCVSEFEGLPVEIQNVVRRPSVLKEWAVLNTDDVDTVVASNFMRSYRQGIKNKVEMKAIPSDVKAMIEGLADKFKMIE